MPGRETAAGYARPVAIRAQGLVGMELLIPKTVRSIFNKGRGKGLVEGRVEGRQEERKRMLAALRESRARGIIPDSSEFEDFILNFEPDKIGDAR